jgi:hypothetical protein
VQAVRAAVSAAAASAPSDEQTVTWVDAMEPTALNHMAVNESSAAVTGGEKGLW